MSIRAYRRFGDFGSESDVAVVGAKGTFEIPHVPPGWYRLSVGTRSTESKDGTGEFVDELIEVQDRDLDDLALVLGPGAGFEMADGNHEVVLFVAPRESPRPTVERTLSSGALVEQFKKEKTFWQQFTMAKEIVERHDASVLPALAGWLNHEDRHLRGNVAFMFAGLGDPRGFLVITDILTDRSDRPHGVIVSGNRSLQAQIREDGYYAAHLLGDLRDPRAVAVLVPLLRDKEINSIVPWALGQIGDSRAIGPLLDTLDDASPSMRVLGIYALDTLHAREALPRLISLLNDHQRSSFGAQVSVADAARAAIAKLGPI